MALLIGIVIGVLAAIPFVVVARRGRLRMTHAIAAVLLSFVLFHVGVLLVRMQSVEELVPAAALGVLAFLGLVIAAARHLG